MSQLLYYLRRKPNADTTFSKDTPKKAVDPGEIVADGIDDYSQVPTNAISIPQSRFDSTTLTGIGKSGILARTNILGSTDSNLAFHSQDSVQSLDSVVTGVTLDEGSESLPWNQRLVKADLSGSSTTLGLSAISESTASIVTDDNIPSLDTISMGSRTGSLSRDFTRTSSSSKRTRGRRESVDFAGSVFMVNYDAHSPIASAQCRCMAVAAESPLETVFLDTNTTTLLQMPENEIREEDEQATNAQGIESGQDGGFDMTLVDDDVDWDKIRKIRERQTKALEEYRKAEQLCQEKERKAKGGSGSRWGSSDASASMPAPGGRRRKSWAVLLAEALSAQGATSGTLASLR